MYFSSCNRRLLSILTRVILGTSYSTYYCLYVGTYVRRIQHKKKGAFRSTRSYVFATLARIYFPFIFIFPVSLFRSARSRLNLFNIAENNARLNVEICMNMFIANQFARRILRSHIIRYSIATDGNERVKETTKIIGRKKVKKRSKPLNTNYSPIVFF